MSDTSVIKVRGLHVHYGASHALQGVNIEVSEGVHSVLGRNGMGKTTLCNAIMGLVPVSSGSVRFEGQELVGKSPHQIARNLMRGFANCGFARNREAHGRPKASMTFFPVWMHAAIMGAGNCRAGSSRCLPFPARFCPIRASW